MSTVLRMGLLSVLVQAVVAASFVVPASAQVGCGADAMDLNKALPKRKLSLPDALRKVPASSKSLSASFELGPKRELLIAVHIVTENDESHEARFQKLVGSAEVTDWQPKAQDLSVYDAQQALEQQ